MSNTLLRVGMGNTLIRARITTARGVRMIAALHPRVRMSNTLLRVGVNNTPHPSSHNYRPPRRSAYEQHIPQSGNGQHPHPSSHNYCPRGANDRRSPPQSAYEQHIPQSGSEQHPHPSSHSYRFRGASWCRSPRWKCYPAQQRPAPPALGRRVSNILHPSPSQNLPPPMPGRQSQAAAPLLLGGFLCACPSPFYRGLALTIICPDPEPSLKPG